MLAFARKGLAVVGTLLTLSNLSLPKAAHASQSTEPIQNNAMTMVLPSVSAATVEVAAIENRQIESEVQHWNTRQGGVVVDSFGAAVTGEEIRLTGEIDMHVIVPRESEAKVNFHRFGYIGVVTEIFQGSRHSHRWNSDIGLYMEAGKDYALPFINCADRSLDMSKATVIVTDTSGEKLHHEKGTLDSTGRYYSFNRASSLRPHVTFNAGDSVQISVYRNREGGKDGIIFAVQGAGKKVSVEIPVKAEYRDAARKMSAHRVVSSVPDKQKMAYRTKNCVASASCLVPWDEMEYYPSLRRMHARIAERAIKSQPQPQKPQTDEWLTLSGPAAGAADRGTSSTSFSSNTWTTYPRSKYAPLPSCSFFLSQNPALQYHYPSMRRP